MPPITARRHFLADASLARSFIQVQDKTLLYESQLSWKDKIPKLFWKGALMVPIRKELITIASEYPWGAFCDFFNHRVCVVC